MATVTYVVDTYQINVGAGDASIHILASRTKASLHGPLADRGQVIRAILIDGGDIAGAEEYLRQSIAAIEARYTFEAPATGLQFDAVVVTHWDSDHYEGQVQLFMQDLSKQYEAEERNVAKRLKDNTSTETLVDRNKLKCKFFKFDRAGQPLTKFYCPVWDGGQATDSRDGDSNGKYNGYCSAYQMPNPTNRLMSILCGKYVPDVPTSLINKGKRKAVGGEPMNIQAEHQWAPAQCEVHYGAKELLGRELFFGNEMEGNPHWSTITSPTALLHVHKPQPATAVKPGLYCVAAQRQIIGKAERPLSGKDTDSPSDQNYGTPSSLTNAMSIACLLIHPDQGPKITLYTGGDGEGDVERRMIPFLKGYAVTVLKVGHHGSAAGTDLTFFRAIDPRAVIFSAGGGGHGHPHWTKLAFMHAYYSAYATTHAELSKPIWSTSYPSWFLASPDTIDPTLDNKKFFNYKLLLTEDSNDAIKARAQAYKATLDQLRLKYETFATRHRTARPLANVHEAWAGWTKGKDLTSNEALRFIRAKARNWFSAQVWPFLSHIEATECHESPALATGQVVSPVDRIRHLFIQHGEGRPARDGTVVIEKGGVWVAPGHSFRIARPKEPDENWNEEMVAPMQYKVTDTVTAGGQPLRGTWKKAREAYEKQQEINSRISSVLTATAVPATDPQVAPSSTVLDTQAIAVLLSPWVDPSDDDIRTQKIAFVSFDSPLADFVHALPFHGLWLKESVRVPTPGVRVAAEVWTHDSTFDWLYSAVRAKRLEIVLMRKSASVVDGVHIAEASITVDLPGESPKGTVTLEFSTSSAAIVAAFGEPLRHAEDTGSLDDFEGMMWAIKPPTEKKAIQLKSLLEAFEIEQPALIAALSDVMLHLESAPLSSSTSILRSFSNAIWLLPHENSLSMLKLSFIEHEQSLLETIIKKYVPGFAISEVKFHLSRCCQYQAPTDTSRYTYSATSTLTITANVLFPSISIVGAITAAIRMEREAIVATLSFNEHKDPVSNALQGLLSWLNDRISASNAGHAALDSNIFSDWLPTLGQAPAISLRRLTMKYGSILEAFRIDLQIDMSRGAPSGRIAPLLIFFSWEGGVGRGSWELTGQLWPLVTLPPDLLPIQFQPQYDALQVLAPPKGDSYVFTLSLLHLSPDIELEEGGVPHGIPTEIHKAQMSITSDRVMFSAGIDCLPTIEVSNVPYVSLKKLQLGATYYYGAEKGFDLTLGGKVSLEIYSASDTQVSSQESLQVALTHDADTKSWIMYASVRSVSMLHLHEFFAPSERSAVMEFMDTISVPFMEVEYRYFRGAPSSLRMLGQLVIGGIPLDYEYNHLGTHWAFAAAVRPIQKTDIIRDSDLSSKQQSFTVGRILHDIDQELLNYVPDLVANIELEPEALAISVLFEKQPAEAGQPTEQDSLVFLITVELKTGKFGSFHLTFAQLHSLSPSPTTSRPLRLFKITLDSFDLSKLKLDLVDKFEQPFEALEYVWSSDNVDRQTMTSLNTEIGRPRPATTKGPLPTPFRFKDGTDGADTKTVILTAGSHFLLVMKHSGKTTVVADSKFGAAPPQSATPANPASATNKSMTGAGELQEAPVKQQLSSLNLTSIGMKMGDKTFNIVMTAKLKLGPIEVVLMGLQLDLNFKNARHLRDWDKIELSASIQGLGLEFKQPPVVLAGLFRKIDTDTFHGYGGGIDLGITPYEFLAAGMYGEGDGPPKFTSVFVFARLNGPLIELEFAEINGICGGFGYNSALRLPDVSQVTTFPFINSSAGSKPDAVDQLNAFTSVDSGAWITPKPGSLWLAAGLGIKAFQLVDIQAVITVGLGSSVQLGLVAEAVAKLPKGVQNDEEVFLLVDFALAATLDLGAGKLAVAGELTPSSFVLHPSCHLTGGFALSYWFENSGHEGDWVFTVGGFHPQFAIPAHYPMPPPRLGISWRYNEHLYLLGEAYFAITPQQCMAGFLLSARFEMGSLSAHFDAHADLFVNYEPFQFRGDSVVSVGASYDLDLGFTTKRINAEIGATVRFHGPPIAGTVHVNLDVFSVDIAFGPEYRPKPPITLDMFWDMLCQGKDKMVYHILAVETGQEVSNNTDMTAQASEPWRVRAGQFSFRVQLRAAASYAYLRKGETTSADFADDFSAPGKICAKLLRRDGNTLESKVRVEVVSSDRTTQRFRMPQAVVKAMPSALWGEYNAFDDPDPTASDLLATIAAGEPKGPTERPVPTVDLITAVKIHPPMPKLVDDIPAFDAMAAFQSDIVTMDGKIPEIPPSISAVPRSLIRNPLPEKQLQDVQSAWRVPAEKLQVNREDVLSTLASLVKDLVDDKRARRYATLNTAPPKQLIAEMSDLYSAAPSIVNLSA